MARQSDLARKRRNRGHTQETLAQRLGVDVSTVARWERGASTPTPRMREALARELALSLDHLAALLKRSTEDRPATDLPARHDVVTDVPELIKDVWTSTERDGLVSRIMVDPPAQVLTGEHAVRVAHQWLITPAPPIVAETTESGRRRRIGTSTLERIRARVRYLHQADDVVAGGDLHAAIRGEVARTAALLRTTSYTESASRALLCAIAELCQLAGWSTADAGHSRTAERYYLGGIQAAHAAGDPVLAAQIVSSLGFHLAEAGSLPRDAVVVTRSALARVDALDSTEYAATPTVRALLHARAAWAHAAAGEPGHATEEIQRAQDEYGRRSNTDPDPTWVYWLTPEEMDVIIGRLDTTLGHPRQAQRRLCPALRQCDPRRVRETAIYTVWLARAHLLVQDTDRAATLADRARQLSAMIFSAYSDRAVRHLTQQLAAIK